MVRDRRVEGLLLIEQWRDHAADGRGHTAAEPGFLRRYGNLPLRVELLNVRSARPMRKAARPLLNGGVEAGQGVVVLAVRRRPLRLQAFQIVRTLGHSRVSARSTPRPGCSPSRTACAECGPPD